MGATWSLTGRRTTNYNQIVIPQPTPPPPLPLPAPIIRNQQGEQREQREQRDQLDRQEREQNSGGSRPINQDSRCQMSNVLYDGDEYCVDCGRRRRQTDLRQDHLPTRSILTNNTNNPPVMQPLRLEGDRIIATVMIGSHIIDAIIDTGASRSCLDEKFAKRILPPIKCKPSSAVICLADGRYIQVKYFAWLDIKLAGRVVTTQVLIMPSIVDSLILGLDFLGAMGTRIQCGFANLIINRDSLRYDLPIIREQNPGVRLEEIVEEQKNLVEEEEDEDEEEAAMAVAVSKPVNVENIIEDESYVESTFYNTELTELSTPSSSSSFSSISSSSGFLSSLTESNLWTHNPCTVISPMLTE